MGILYVQTTGNAANSGSSDNDSPDLSGTAASVSGTTITLDSGTVLTGVVTTPGATQSTINLAGATNTGGTIFWITATAGSGGATPTVTIDTTPTGITTGVSWRIGGRYLFPSAGTANVIERALGLSTSQDILQFNDTPATKTVTYITFRNAATAATGGAIIVRGKTGVRPVLNSGSVSCFNANVLAGQTFRNLELKTTNTNGVLQNNTSGVRFENCVASGSYGFILGAHGSIINCELNVSVGDGITVNSTQATIIGNYIHGCAGNGVTISGVNPNATISDNLIVGNTGRGVYLSGASTSSAHAVTIEHNTIVDNGSSGVEIADADTIIQLRNNIIRTAAAGVNTVKWAAGSDALFSNHTGNVIWQSNSSTSGVSGFTLDSTDIASDPLFTNSAGGDYTVTSSSPAVASGFPGVFTNYAQTGYRTSGALQRQASAGGTIGVIGS